MRAFPEIPTDLSALSDEDLATLESEAVAAFNEATPEAATPDDVAALSAVADSIERLRGEATTRAEAFAATQAAIAELATRVNPANDATPTDPEPDPEDEPADPAEPAPEAPPAPEAVVPAEPAPEVLPIAASTRPAPTLAEMSARQPIRTRPRPALPQSRVTITAAADVAGRPLGSPLMNTREIAEALLERRSHLGHGRGGPEDAVPVVHFEMDYGDRHFDARTDANDNMAKLAGYARGSLESLTASGGLCAPTEGYYDQLVIADADRPVRDALPRFGATRGGIRFNPPPKLSTITSGVGTVTAAQDLAGGGGGTKNTFHVTCPAITEVTVAAVYNSMEFGNFLGRSFPEQVEAFVALAAALQARTAEQNLLDGIAAGSTAVTSAGLVGAGREYLARISQAAAGYRSRNRMAPNAVLTVLLPAWSRPYMRADFARTFTDDPDLLGIEDAQIDAFFRARDLDVHYYLDSKTGGNQVFGTQGAGVLLEFPTAVLAYVFAPGTFLFLDGGTLDLGVVRDSSLNSVNNFRMFTEVFENVAFVGVESLEITLSLCPDGSYGAAKSVTCPIVT